MVHAGLYSILIFMWPLWLGYNWGTFRKKNNFSPLKSVNTCKNFQNSGENAWKWQSKCVSVSEMTWIAWNGFKTQLLKSWHFKNFWPPPQVDKCQFFFKPFPYSPKSYGLLITLFLIMLDSARLLLLLSIWSFYLQDW